ncbi:hypothetical protein AOLI_G00043060 [Acnodon oligacanthus]
MAEIEKSKVKLNLLSGQISSQFKELHQFLRKKEEEIKKQLEMEEKRCLEPMVEKKTMIETSYSCLPIAECFIISPRTPLIVSPDGLSVQQREVDLDDQKAIYSNEKVNAEETFTTGQHYLELEVGQKLDWTVGVEKRMEGTNLLARLSGWTRYISKVHLRLT